MDFGMFHSTASNGAVSRIVLQLDQGVVVLTMPNRLAGYVVTEQHY